MKFLPAGTHWVESKISMVRPRCEKRLDIDRYTSVIIQERSNRLFFAEVEVACMRVPSRYIFPPRRAYVRNTRGV